MSGESTETRTVAERPYQKVDFHTPRASLGKLFDLLLWPVWLFILIASIFLNLEWLFVGLFVLLAPLVIFTLAYRGLVYRNIGYSALLVLWLVFTLPIMASTGWLVLDIEKPGWVLALNTMSFIFFVTLAPDGLQMIMFPKYPPMIAVAEQRTDEYMNGYSPRPAQYNFPEFHREKMLALARFLRSNLLLNGIKEDNRSITLFIPSSVWWRPFFWGERSYIRLFSEGKVELFVAPEDYNYLKVPISYHLLSQEMAKRLWKAYLYFEKDMKKEALGQFRVRRKKTAYQKMKEEKARGEAG